MITAQYLNYKYIIGFFSGYSWGDQKHS